MKTHQQPNIITLQLICFALCAGMLIFAIVAIVTTIEGKSPGTQQNPAPSSSLGLLLLVVAGGLGIGNLVAGPAIRLAAVRGAKELWRGDGSVEEREHALWSRFTTQVVTRAAFAESLGIVGILALFLGGPPLGWWGMAAPAIALVLIFWALPSQFKYESFLAQATSEA
ncbi:MAG: hypothetical protein KF691_14025 [Phycisphaeraceae bacterium]|nr:hypothetical protein [Phycisphaeraceae bacterium]